MQTNYYFLRQLSERLATELAGLVLAECFSQERDELVLGFCTDGKQWKRRREFYIRAVIRPDFVCLNFPEEFRRASKNSVDLFSELLDLPVRGLKQYLNERAFAIEFENDFLLVFKLFGNRSNIVLVQNGEVKALFNSKLVSDNALDVRTLDRPLDQSYEAWEQHQFDYRKIFPTWGKHVVLPPLGSLSKQEAWERISDIRKQLESPTYYLTELQHEPTLALLPVGDVKKVFNDPLTAVNEFYYAYTRLSSIEREKGGLVRDLQKRLNKTKAYIEQQYQKLDEIEKSIKHEEIGHILMAYLHEIPEKAEVVELFDFYREQTISIKLKADLSPQKNAEVYYRKAKNEKIEVEKISEHIAQKEQDMAQLQEHLRQIEAIEQLKALRKYVKEHQLNVAEREPQTAELFKKVEFMGFEIFIGRNAKNNDLLTQRYARKEDLWLHARDVAGSHVVIRHQAGKKIPNPVVERAAQLAAYYSKRKNDSLCPVIVTPRKYVRKTRDLTEGQVIIDKEEVVMVEPMA